VVVVAPTDIFVDYSSQLVLRAALAGASLKINRSLTPSGSAFFKWIDNALVCAEMLLIEHQPLVDSNLQCANADLFHSVTRVNQLVIRQPQVQLDSPQGPHYQILCFGGMVYQQQLSHVPSKSFLFEGQCESLALSPYLNYT
jgi:hypothetical protein